MAKTSLQGKIEESVNFLSKKISTSPRVAIIFGSGLGGEWLQKNSGAISIPYSKIPHYPQSTVKGHGGRLIFGKTAQIPWVAAEGRFHYYEGYSMEEVVYPIRVMKSLGVQQLLLTNAAGGLNPQYKRGDFVFITDHINLTGQNPLRGPNNPLLGPRFVDMNQAYNPDIIKLLLKISKSIKLKTRKGVYLGIAGPSYETPAEVRMFRKLGADVIGMSTVPEVIAAAHASLPCAVISCITNMLLPHSKAALSHELVIKTAQENQNKLYQLLEKYLCKLKLS